MEENIILQIVMHDDEGIEVRVNNDNKVSPLLLIGILEQVKMNILSGGQMEEINPSKESTTKTYDA
jgi:hypothetical protein